MNTGTDRGFRADIQVLRCVAVLLVITEHYFHPDLLPGAFVGIDVFFVISGYLVLGGLLRAAREGRVISLKDFFARRMRRILPAAIVVALLAFIVFGRLLNPIRVDEYGQQLVACALFVGNFVLREQRGGYFAPIDPSPYLHFWSLGVEEQFYFFAPLLVLGIFAVPFLRSRALTFLALAAVGSFAFSVWISSGHAMFAYFMLPTRAWELLVGGLAALVTVPPRWRRRVLWLGALLLVVGVGLARPSFSVPGFGVLAPVLGTAMILVAGSVHHRDGSSSFPFPVRALTSIGDASYSMYLWHWAPLCWLLLRADGAPIELKPLLIALAISFALAVLTYRCVEQPFRHAGWPLRRPRATLTGAVGLVVAVATVGVLVPIWTPLTSARTAQALSEADVLAGPLTGPSYVPRDVVPTLRTVHEVNRLYAGCHNGEFDPALHPCVFGDPEGRRTVVLAGDSHAAHWLDALDTAGKELGFRLITLTKSSCPVAAPDPAVGIHESCQVWGHAVRSYLEKKRPSVALFGSGTFAYSPRDVARGRFLSGVEAAWREVLADVPADVRAVVIGDVPNPPQDIAGCLARNLEDARRCEFTIDSLHEGIAAVERSTAAATGARYLQTDRWLCASRCAVLAGNVVIYRDSQGHLTPEVSALLAPRMESELRTSLSRTVGHLAPAG